MRNEEYLCEFGLLHLLKFSTGKKYHLVYIGIHTDTGALNFLSHIFIVQF